MEEKHVPYCPWIKCELLPRLDFLLFAHRNWICFNHLFSHELGLHLMNSLKLCNPDQWIWWPLSERTELTFLWSLSGTRKPFIKLLLLQISLERGGEQCPHEQRSVVNATHAETGNFWKYIRIHLWRGILIFWLEGIIP